MIEGQQFRMLYGKWIVGCKRAMGRIVRKLLWCRCEMTVGWTRMVLVVEMEEERRGVLKIFKM